MFVSKLSLQFSFFPSRNFFHSRVLSLLKLNLGNGSLLRGEPNESETLFHFRISNSILLSSKHHHKAMSLDKEPKLTFLSQANPVTGKMEWVPVERDDYDYVQEIARSGYGDMLHDVDRNVKYYAAIRKVIKSMKAEGKSVKVLDIGTGTGLLSMMAAESGADNITACEAFMPMANCASKVLKVNSFGEKVKLVPKRSTEVLLGDDLTEKANLLVTELFDTELIGEGAIPSYTDAHDRMMEDDCVAVPSLGIMYVQAVQSSLLQQWNSLQLLRLPNGLMINVPVEFDHCAGAPSLHDLQIDQLKDDMTLLSEPVEVFRFDFSKKKALKKDEHSLQTVKALADGKVDAFVMWWDLEMDPQGEIILSCAPCWTRKDGDQVPWRDHWMQAVYYPSAPLTVKGGQHFDVHSYHDEYSLWFDAKPTDGSHPVCSCGLHVTMSRSRLAQMNCPHRNHIFMSALQKHINSDSTCLVISDGSLLSLIAALLGARKVFCIDNNPATQKILKKLVCHNGLEERITFIRGDLESLSPDCFEGLKIDVVVSEPYFQGVHLPWQHLYFWYALSSLRPHLDPAAVILPRDMTIKCMAVEFRDLHKIRAPVGICEGFDISHFDELIENSSSSVDEEVEPQPLWEYPCRSLSEPKVLMNLQFDQSVHNMEPLTHQQQLECVSSGNVNGLAFWTEFKFGNDLVLNCGLVEGRQSKDFANWDKTNKQGVRLFRHSRHWNEGDKMTVNTSFDPANGDISFDLS